MKLSVRTVRVRMRAPLRAAHGADDVRELILVRVEDDDGTVGFGEAAPLPSYDGVPAAAVTDALSRYEKVLAAERCGVDPSEVLGRCAAACALPQALAAIDLVLWDLAGRRAGEPVWRLLRAADRSEPGAGADLPPTIPLNATIGAESPPVAGRLAGAAVAAGYRCIKVKVGAGDDRARVAAVRAAVGPGVAIRVDANGAWDEPGAAVALAALAPHEIELCEEPVHGGSRLAGVGAASQVPVYADESALEVIAAGTRGVTGVCLKVAACGGISGLLRDAARARAAGLDVYLASTLDGPLGIAAALHAAAVVRPDRASGLATLDRFDAPDPLPVTGGELRPPDTPGLGRDLPSWY